MEILTPGSIIFGRYKVVDPFAAGGQSFGYRAEDTRAPRNKPWLHQVFLKQYHDLIPGSRESRALDQHFESLRLKLDEKSNYICLPAECGEAANSVIAVYPWVEGMTLKDYIERGLGLDERVRLANALAKTVRIIHKQGIAHLDLKPQNVVVKERVKDGLLYLQLIDLDSARIDGEGLRSLLVHTPGYSSPEHYFPEHFGQVSIKSDVFTLGIIIAELLFGQHPFAEVNDYREAVARESFYLPESNYHGDVVEVIIRCLRTEPRLRPTAGWVQKIFTQHHANRLQKVHDAGASGSSKERKLFLQIEGISPTVDFRRTYYDTSDLGRNEFRGANIPSVPSKLLRFSFGSRSCSLTLLTSNVEVLVSGRRLYDGRSIELSSNQELTINGVRFLVKVGSFNLV